MKTKKKKENHKQKGKHNFPSCPAAGAGYPDCPVIVRYLMEIKSLLMSHVSGQSQSVLVFLSSLSSWDSLPNGRRRGTGRSHWLFLTLFVEKKKKGLKKSQSTKKTLQLSSPTLPCSAWAAPPDGRYVVFPRDIELTTAAFRSTQEGEVKSQPPTF